MMEWERTDRPCLSKEVRKRVQSRMKLDDCEVVRLTECHEWGVDNLSVERLEAKIERESPAQLVEGLR